MELESPAPDTPRSVGPRKIALWKIFVIGIALGLILLCVLYLPYRTRSSIMVHGEPRSDCSAWVSRLAEPPDSLRAAGLSFDPGAFWWQIGRILFVTALAVWGPFWKKPGQEPSSLNVVGVFLLAALIFFTTFAAVAARDHPTYLMVCPSNDIAE